jgi:hypothetical protein
MHSSNGADIDAEFEKAKEAFRTEFSSFEQDKEYEFTPWHHNLRLLWVYLYNDATPSGSHFTRNC